MKSFLATSLFIFVAISSFAQHRNKFYLKFGGTEVNTRDSADYIRVVSEPDPGSKFYNVKEFFVKGDIRTIAKSSDLDGLTYEGLFVNYYGNGEKRSVVNYKNGIKNGNDYEYYTNGRLYSRYVYPENSNFYGNYLIMANSDSLGNELVTDGNGYYKGYDKKFAYIEEEGLVKDGKREGTWKYNFRDSKTTLTEIYNNGILISGIAIDKDGKSSSYNAETQSVIPEFKGGNKEFVKFLQRNIKYPESARSKGIQGRVILNFSVETTGELVNITIGHSVDPALDEEALRVLKMSPKWRPGVQYGKLVKVKYSVPISFAL